MGRIRVASQLAKVKRFAQPEENKNRVKIDEQDRLVLVFGVI